MARTLLTTHAVHVVAVGVPVVMVAVGLAWDAARTRRATGPRAGRSSVARRGWPRVAAMSSAAAAAVHLAVVPAHVGESLLYAAFFAGAAAAQLGGAWLLWTARSRTLFALAAVGNAGIIALWMFTRLVAIPIGPAAGTTENFGRLDVTASLCEATVVVACLVCMRRTRPARAALDTRQGSRLVNVG